MKLAQMLQFKPSLDPAVMDRSRPPFPVERSPAHERAEQVLASLRQRRKEAAERADSLIGMSVEKQKAVAEYDAIHAEVMACRRALVPMRNRHLQNIRTAYRQPQRDAARRALASLAEAESAIAEINATFAVQRKAGGVHRDLDASKILVYLVAPLERLARESEKSS